MIGLDTNVLVRLVTGDDKAQSAIVVRYLKQKLEAGETFYINLIVLTEAVWVLKRLYRYSKPSLLQFLNGILANEGLIMESEAAVEIALSMYENSRADFSDCLIAAKNAWSGCGETATLDQNAAMLSGFVQIS